MWRNGGVKTAMSVHNVEHNLNFTMYYQLGLTVEVGN